LQFKGFDKESRRRALEPFTTAGSGPVIGPHLAIQVFRGATERHTQDFSWEDQCDQMFLALSFEYLSHSIRGHQFGVLQHPSEKYRRFGTLL
jgi:hypothetical protein